MLDTLAGNFGLAFTLSVVVLGATAVAASVAWLRASRGARPAAVAVARAVAPGAALLIVAATATPFRWPPELGTGDLALGIGAGGLGNLPRVLAQPGSLAWMLLLLNLSIYAPLTFSAALGWPTRRWSILAAALGLSLLVEALQLLVLDRVAATDDVLLNMAGATVGLLFGFGMRRGIGPGQSGPVGHG